MLKFFRNINFYVLGLLSTFSFAQQVPDLNYRPEIASPAYTGYGPIILIDEGHHNFHTKNGRYKPFANILERDGYIVESHQGEFTVESVSKGKILVIANALNEVNVEEWNLPNPSAFTEEEINVLDNWVSDGGSLFLIADHMPFPGAAEELAARFGFKFHNGFNVDIRNPAYFRRSDGSLTDNVISNGRDSSEMIFRIPKTEGQAFEIPNDAEPILKFYASSLILFPEQAWYFHEDTPLMRAEGMAQGAFKKHGKGRVVVFGEASMFSAQIGQPGNRKMGMNSETAKDNYKLLLNIIHWLDGILDK
jgi:hypothetical protein